MVYQEAHIKSRTMEDTKHILCVCCEDFGVSLSILEKGKERLLQEIHTFVASPPSFICPRIHFSTAVVSLIKSYGDEANFAVR